MKPTQIAEGIIRAILYLFLITLGAYCLYLLQSLIIYIVFAAILSLIGKPIAGFLVSRLKFNKTIAVVTTMLFFILILLGVISLIIPLIIQQSENLSLLDVQSLEIKVNKLFEELSNYYGWNKSSIEAFLSGNNWVSTLNLGAVPEFLNSILGWLSGFTIALFSILFISFFLLKDSHLLERSLLIFFPNDTQARLKGAFSEIKNLLSRYFIGLFFQISILFAIYTTILVIFGIKNAMIIALLCSLLNLIPYVGPIIGGMLMFVLTMTANVEADFRTVILPKSMYVMIGFIFGQLVDNFFSQPYIFSKSVKSHPLEIFVIVISAGILFGTLGLIAAIPLYTAAKVIFKAFYANNRIVKSLTKDL